MAIYAIGDLQGCLNPLLRLLDLLQFDPAADRLWFAGDLVSRGPQSLETLRFVRSLGHSAVSVLGNHDVSLIAAHYGALKPHRSVLPLLAADDAPALIEWLRQRPFLHVDETCQSLLVHAGIAPGWDFGTAVSCARELEQEMRQTDPSHWLKKVYGNQPDHWDRHRLKRRQRQRYMLNAFTRMRYCHADGRLEFEQKLAPEQVRKTHPELRPWFQVQGALEPRYTVFFGHWSTLGFHREGSVISLDSGCVWGGQLSAVRVDAVPGTRWYTDCTEYGRHPT
ncbi:MAG: symmetrical bis(5'-nucleosyl)-tetraphosphatase [Thiothrix sp.]|nr:symmetrical bis(5'-nucleosyl)-tetraphosphatase [Thiothrix sp.]